MTINYHEGDRRLQDQFDSRRIADRLDDVAARTAFTDHDKTFIECRLFFFVATASAAGHPTCNFNGAPGFVRVIALVFPDYGGNGMFLSLGTIATTPQVGLLFIDFERPKRLRVDGEAPVLSEDPLIRRTLGAQLIERVKARAIYPNCRATYPRCNSSSRRSMHRAPVSIHRSPPGRIW